MRGCGCRCRFPSRTTPRHPAAVGALAARCAQALGGRTFVLTTTLRVLPLIAEALRQALQHDGAAIEVLVQGSQPKRALLQRFWQRARLRAGGLAELLGGHRRARRRAAVRAHRQAAVSAAERSAGARRACKQIEARGGNAFNEYFVAEAAVSLKQGAGRLIRSESDRGLLVVCDPRMRQMNYGARLRAALPPMTELAQEAAGPGLAGRTGRRAH